MIGYRVICSGNALGLVAVNKAEAARTHITEKAPLTDAPSIPKIQSQEGMLLLGSQT